MNRVAVSAAVLRWVLERSGKASALQRKFPELQAWERGESQPTLRQLERLAKETATPFGYLFLPEPPEERLPIPHFRTIADQPALRPSPDLLETVHTMERRQAWMREYLVDQAREPLSFVRSARLGDEPDQVARKMREVLGLVGTWAAGQRTWSEALDELRRRVEEAGILVTVSGIVGNNTRRKLDPTEFRGFVLVDEYAPLVFVNGVDAKAAQMFTLVHELAHLWLGSSAAFDLRELQPASDATEQACNRVAAEFLVPERELRQLWPSARRDPEPFQTVARQFKVSTLVAARRALDLGLITRGQFLDFYQVYQEDERRKAAKRPEGGNFYATQNLRLGRRFAEAVVHAATEGKLSYREAYQLTGLYGKTYRSVCGNFQPWSDRMTDGPSYLLDADVFMTAARSYYAFDVAPAFWEGLVREASSGRLLSIDRVKDEILRGRDELAKWADGTFHLWFASTGQEDVIAGYRGVMRWVQAQSLFFDYAREEFARGADGWVVAYAKAKSCVVVTNEKHEPGIRRRVKIPNVCQAFDIPCANTFEMLRALGIKLG